MSYNGLDWTHYINYEPYEDSELYYFMALYGPDTCELYRQMAGVPYTLEELLKGDTLDFPTGRRMIDYLRDHDTNPQV